jgi:alcohol dehydrogenase class IV
MAITMRIEFPATTEQYDEVDRRLDLENNPPDGLIIHTAAEVGEGMLRVVDVWESAEQFHAFNESRLMPLVSEVMGGPPVDTEPTPPEITELHNVYRP